MTLETPSTESTAQSRITTIGKLNYLDFFGFSRPPFRNASDVSEPFLNATLGAAKTRLEAIFEEPESGVVVVDGAPGSGKTTLTNYVVDRRVGACMVAKINHTLLPEKEFLQVLLHGFGLQADRLDPMRSIGRFRGWLSQRNKAGKRAILVIDEAHNLQPEVFRQLPLLIEPDASTQTRLYVVLLGRESLGEDLARPYCKRLAALIRYQTRLTPLSPADTSSYIRHQLAIAGGSRTNPLTDRAMLLIHQYTGGSMRLINTLCDFVLFNAYMGQIHRISPELVKTTFNALQWDPAGDRDRQRAQTTGTANDRVSRLILEYDRNTEYPLAKQTVTIGRATSNDICIRDLRISRCHARLVTDQDGTSIEDLDSKNGVYVNGTRVAGRRLEDGDLIAIDAFAMRFSSRRAP